MVEPNPNAVALADEMMGRDDIMRTIISETIEMSENGTPQEAGRTYCEAWGSILRPTDTGTNSINLQTCVSGAVGVWHTHPGAEGLTQPINSLPDMANAVFGHVDASVVPGVETADIIVAPADPDAAQEEFRRAIGADVQSALDVRDAITARRIDPVQSRRRAREVLSGLIVTADTGYTDLGAPQAVAAGPTAAAGSQAVCACSTEESKPAPTYPSACLEDANSEFDLAAENVEERIDNLNIGSIAISAAVGNVVGEVVNRVLFD